MSEPVVPRLFVQELLGGGLTHWVACGAQQGCVPDIDGSRKPLVPRIVMPANDIVGLNELHIPAPEIRTIPRERRVTLRMWFSEDEDYGPETVVSVLQSLRWASSILCLSCSGNRPLGIRHRFTVEKSYALTLGNLLQAAYPRAHITVEAEDEGLAAELAGHREQELLCRELLPPAPFWGCFAKGGIEYNALYSTLMTLDASAYGIFQVVLSPLSGQWCSLVRALAKAEVLAAERSRTQTVWGPSEEAWRRAETKLAGPLFGACVRAGLVISPGKEEEGNAVLDSLVLGLAGLSFSGGPVELVDQTSLIAAGVEPEALSESFADGSVFHHCPILSPTELALFFPLPPADRISSSYYKLDRVPEFVAGLGRDKGVFLANEVVFGKLTPVTWPDAQRTQHMLITGGSGYGKTAFAVSVSANIVNSRKQEGLAIIDPHDTAIDRFVQCVDDDRLDDCILHDPMDEDYVLCLPLFDCPDVDQIDTAVSNVTDQIRALFARADMGHNIERGIRNIVRTVFTMPDMTLWDARRLLEATGRGGDLREQVCSEIEDEMLIDYWQSDFPTLDRGSMARIRSRIDLILEPRRLRTLLMNKTRKISHLEIEDRGLIFLARTSPASAGTDQARLLDLLHMNGFQTAAGVRSGHEGERRPFTIVADEFGNYSNPKTVPHALRTLRKYDVSEILIAQNVDALPNEVKAALGNVNTHVVFQQGWEDAHYYFKSFGGAVSADRFLMKDVGEAYAKIGKRLAAIRCPLPLNLRGLEVLEEIRANTRERYCMRRDEFRERMLDEHHVSIEDMKALDLV